MRFEREFAFLGAVALVGCTQRGPAGDEPILARSSTVAAVVAPRAAGPSVEARFGLAPRAHEPVADDGGVAEARGMLRWDLPAGWVERAPSAMRIANFLAAGDPLAECYLTILAGDAGGLGANVNRWLGQLGRPALGPSDMDALPRAKLLERDAVLLEAQGDFTGMSGGAARTGQRLLGLLLVDPAGSAFLKFVGPDAVVVREREAFLQLAASFRSAPAAETDAQPSAAMREERAAGLRAAVPADWMRVTARPPRALDLRIDDSTECSITVLPGEAGGARSNLDRWRGQIGLPALDDAQFAALERVSLLGAPGLLVEASNDGAGLLGAVLCAPDRSVFVKLTGPAARVARERTAFLDLCRTLEDG